jgi:hypothetical protein
MRYGIIVLSLLLFSAVSAKAQVSIGIGLPNVSIGINLPMYPELVRVPNYPVYYAPRMDANYFFYDGMYWVYQNDTWYASSWYNGPWGAVDPYYVPLYILRVPVRYYRQPPVYFRGWVSTRPPHWEQHWGHDWGQRRSGWNHWNRNAAPAPAPLPVYQRKYAGDRYPRVEQQHTLRSQQYRYQPKDKVVRQHLQQHAPRVVPPHQVRPAAKPDQQQQPAPRVAPQPQAHPVVPQHQQPQRSVEHPKHPAPVQAHPQPAVHQQKPQPAPAVHKQKEQKHQEKGQYRQSDQGHGQDKDEDRGRGHR